MQKQTHFHIFERFTEEEFVLTLSDLLLRSGYKVSLSLSERIWSLIQMYIDKPRFENIYIFNNKEERTEKILNHITDYNRNNNVSLTFIPSFISHRYQELFEIRSFLKNNKVCHLIAEYNTWLKPFPPILFEKKKIFRIKKFLDWFYLRLLRNKFQSFFITEVEVNSKNPLKYLIKKNIGKKVFEFPFKMQESLYNPEFNYDIPIFVIPGSIDKDRRNYQMIIDIFEDSSFKKYNWKIILLGRPVGSYGNSIIYQAEKINKEYSEERIQTFNSYISKKVFDDCMNKSTHIIANINKKGYKYGKDSGAIYDVFKYNKLGIFDSNYFYDKESRLMKVLHIFENKDELKYILLSVIRKEFDYLPIVNKIKEVSPHYCINSYVKSVLVQNLEQCANDEFYI